MPGRRTFHHMVVRVPPGGDTFTAYVLNAEDVRGTVKARFDPFAAQDELQSSAAEMKTAPRANW